MIFDPDADSCCVCDARIPRGVSGPCCEGVTCPKERKEKTMDTEYWWQTPVGIRGHFADEQKALTEEYQRKAKALNDLENQMLEALANATKGA
jgi:hypothetical protein